MTFSGSMSASNVILPQKHPPSIFIWLHLRNARCRAAGISVLRERYVLVIIDPQSRLFCLSIISRPCPRSSHEVSSVAQFALQKTQEAHVSSGGHERLSFPKIPSGADSRYEAESAHHPARCSPSFSCLGCLSPTRLGRGAGLKSRTSFSGLRSILL